MFSIKDSVIKSEPAVPDDGMTNRSFPFEYNPTTTPTYYNKAIIYFSRFNLVDFSYGILARFDGIRRKTTNISSNQIKNHPRVNNYFIYWFGNWSVKIDHPVNLSNKIFAGIAAPSGAVKTFSIFFFHHFFSLRHFAEFYLFMYVLLKIK